MEWASFREHMGGGIHRNLVVHLGLFGCRLAAQTAVCRGTISQPQVLVFRAWDW